MGMARHGCSPGATTSTADGAATGPTTRWHFLDDRGNPIRLASGPVYIGLTDVPPVVE